MTMANTADMALADRANTPSRSSVLRPKNMVPVILAQLRPLAFIRAIHTHRPTPMTPTMTTTTISTVTRLLMCWLV